MMRFRDDHEYICAECFGDPGMKAFCSDHAQSHECDFCGATAPAPTAAPINDVIEHVKATIQRYYDDPVHTGLPYESAEGGWQGDTWYTCEIFDELGLNFPRDRGSRLYDAISGGLDNDLWAEVEPYALSPGEHLQFSWERFCKTVKHQRRYFFLQEEDRKKPMLEQDELYSPAEILKTIFSFARGAGAFITLPEGTSLFRARFCPEGECYETAGSLGPPPTEHAIKTNRMSLPGVVMNYAAEDRRTALAETADEAGSYAVGEFKNGRELLILDLTRLPRSAERVR